MIKAKQFATVRVGELKGQPEDIILCRGLARYVYEYLVNGKDLMDKSSKKVD